MQPRDRIPPSNVSIEKAVLGACFIGGREVCNDVYEWLGGGVALYNSHNRRILNAIMTVCKEGYDPDLLAVVDALKQSDELEEVGGVSALAEVAGEMATAANVQYHCRIVVDDYNRRRFITHHQDLVYKAYERAEVPVELYSSAQSFDMELEDSQELETLGDVVHGTADEIEDAMKSPGEYRGVPTGLRCLDRMLGGWQREEMVIIAARPSQGKTALALHCARRAQSPAFFVSAEMSKRMVALRLLAAETGIPTHQLKVGNMDSDEYERFKKAEVQLKKSEIIIDDRIRSPALISSEAKRMQASHNIQAVFVDYLQLLDPPRMERGANREREVSTMSGMLKHLAKDTGMPTIVLAQLNRQVEYSSRRPQKSDLRDSGSIEQDADVIIFIHPVQDTRDIVELVVDKNRNGPTGIHRVRFTKETGVFTSLDNQQS